MSGQKFEQCLSDYKADFGDGLLQHLTEPVTGFPFAELLLMGFIEANPVRGAKKRQRLSDAMKALFGDRGRSRSDEKDDTIALMSMAYQYARRVKAGCPPNLYEIAENAAPYADKGADTVERLVRKFRKRRAGLLLNEEETRNHVQDIHMYALEDIVRK